MFENMELTFEKLKYKCDSSLFGEWQNKGEGIEQSETLDEVIGQEKALKAFDFGLKIKEKGYNIYLGSNSENRIKFVQHYLKNIAKNMKTPDDWCYVYNFDDPSKPKPLRLKSGYGEIFKEDIDELFENFLKSLKEQFDSVEFELQKNKILELYKEKDEDLIKKIKFDAEEFEFDAQVTDKDIYFIPIISNKKLSEEMFDELNEEQQKNIIRKSQILQQRATAILRKVRLNQKEADREVKKLQCNIAEVLLKDYIDVLLEKHKEYEQVTEYIRCIEEDIIKNIDEWISMDKHDENILSLLPALYKNLNSDLTKKYKVNLLVDNSDTEGAPIIYGINPSFYNLIGKVEQENELGNVKMDIAKIRAGLLHKANGGFLILEVEEMLSHAYSWYILKLILKSENIYFKEIKENANASVLTTLNPIPIPLDIKIILVGENIYYNLLYQYESSFKELFKIKVCFDNEVEGSKDNKDKIIKYINKYIKEKGIQGIEKDALLSILKYSSRLVMNREKIVSSMEPINELLIEICEWATENNLNTLNRDIIQRALLEKENRVNLIEKKLDELIVKNQIMIDVKGKKVGQINALAVLDVGDYIFAKPTRITATTFKGKAGIINIEKEADMSGKVHNKGVHVLSGYLGHKYAQKFPLSLTCQICFEQSYSMIDGDSASSAELYAILSSLSGIPLKQNIAVTGSINQFGEIQPIGGATYKVEGFFNICKKKGLTGDQGVIIPYQNEKDLVLKDEVLQAVKNKQFHIYIIKNIDEGLEILTSESVSKIHNLVYKKLK